MYFYLLFFIPIYFYYFIPHVVCTINFLIIILILNKSSNILVYMWNIYHIYIIVYTIGIPVYVYSIYTIIVYMVYLVYTHTSYPVYWCILTSKS